jgi:hypothetical protein
VRSLIAIAMLVVAAAPAHAASLVLSNGEREQALAVGERSIVTETFDDEWRVKNDVGETALVLTPFHRMALAARHAAFRNEPLKPADQEKLIKEQADRLIIWANLRGDREDFARFYAPRLMLGTREIAPTFVQNERTAVPASGGGFVARCVYGFPTKDLSGKARVVLVVRDADRRDVTRFAINLAEMR